MGKPENPPKTETPTSSKTETPTDTSSKTETPNPSETETPTPPEPETDTSFMGAEGSDTEALSLSEFDTPFGTEPLTLPNESSLTYGSASAFLAILICSSLFLCFLVIWGMRHTQLRGWSQAFCGASTALITAGFSSYLYMSPINPSVITPTGIEPWIGVIICGVTLGVLIIIYAVWFCKADS